LTIIEINKNKFLNGYRKGTNGNKKASELAGVAVGTRKKPGFRPSLNGQPWRKMPAMPSECG